MQHNLINLIQCNMTYGKADTLLTANHTYRLKPVERHFETSYK